MGPEPPLTPHPVHSLRRSPRPRLFHGHPRAAGLPARSILPLARAPPRLSGLRPAQSACLLRPGNARPACAHCTGNTARYGCAECGREDNPFGTKCGSCTLTERLTALLERLRPAPFIPRLQPVFDTLNTGPRAQTTLYWLIRKSSRPDVLQSMARGELDISHDV